MGERSGQVGDLERVGDRLHLGQAGTKDSIGLMILAAATTWRERPLIEGDVCRPSLCEDRSERWSSVCSSGAERGRWDGFGLVPAYAGGQRGEVGAVHPAGQDPHSVYRGLEVLRLVGVDAGGRWDS